ncbi:alpha/beta hydrolase [Kribbella capetownensis]|uniref:Alpha/beta hydrolase n=1 Tax=Kribbella capetownensis TaxID=1572659 RepID=A0A4R0IU80_9ACTN|nr:alpha/beta hydrolase [Kribbella capetownensis]TCC37473.1 alpha/beta hydrolase [Kribbella capetownensis]
MFQPGFDDHRHTVSTLSGEISYVEIGAGAPALFVHGIATNAHIWQNLIPLLADTRRCVAIDLPLHGQSQAAAEHQLTVGAFADTLAEVCASLRLDRIDLVGHDTGGAIVQVFAARHPELIHTLTLTNCETQDNIPPEAMAATVDAARAGQLGATAPALLADPAAARSFFAPSFENPNLLSAEMVDSFLRPVIGTPATAARFQELIAALGPDDLLAAEPSLRDLQAATLIAWATDDEFFDLKWAHWLHHLLPGARDVVEIDGGKLFFPFERADELASHIRHHWTTADASVPKY